MPEKQCSMQRPGKSRPFLPWDRKRIRLMLCLTVLWICSVSLGWSLSVSKQTNRRQRMSFADEQRKAETRGRRNILLPRNNVQYTQSSLFLSESARYSGAGRNEEIRIGTDELLAEAETTKRKVLQLLRGNEFAGALQSIQNMFSTIEALGKSLVGGGDELVNRLSGILDETIQLFTNAAFSEPHRGSRSQERIRHGLGALQLQLSSAGILSPPYDSCPKATLTLALEAVSAVISSGAVDDRNRDVQLTHTAFRILQRLVTGMGVRHVPANGTPALSERDFNIILNALCNAEKMDLAQKVVGLQDRTPNAPPLSAVSYSILLKGYGRLKDTRNVNMALRHAQSNGIQPDKIMLNSAIDAYVNCGEVDRARDVFDYMIDGDFDLSRLSQFKMLFSPPSRPVANQRTYNTMLKGLARQGNVDSALEIAERMRVLKLWDGITTNTLVSAAVSAENFDLAEELLLNHTIAVDVDLPQKNSNKKKKHPNVEAYTELLDAYAKASRLDKAMATLKLMRQRGVEPNQHTYSSAVGALARAKKVTQASALLRFMKTTGTHPGTVVYNAFISGLVAEDQCVEGNPQNEVNLDRSINEGIAVLRSMLSAGVRPNSVTVSVLVGALGRSSPPRVDEAKAIVEKLETEGFISRDHPMIATSLIRAFGQAGDLRGAVQTFSTVRSPDTVAINTFMEVCCQNEYEKRAFDTFQHFFGKNSSGKTQPDVISYSVLIKALLKRNSPILMERTRRLYDEMKTKRRIKPDKALVDIILRAMIRGGRIGLQRKDIQFTLDVIRDAEGLDWAPGQFEKRKRAVRAVMVGRMSEVWKEDEDGYGMRSTEDEIEDPLFMRHGWNKVDSGFSLWGRQGGSPDQRKDLGKLDKFLQEKGWNDVDSGFRII